MTDTLGDGSGDAVLIFPDGGRLILDGVPVEDAIGAQNLYAMGVPCFVAGTPILTSRGPVAVEDIVIGDLLVTVEGLRPVVWVGGTLLDGQRLSQRPDWRPIHFPVGAIGNDRPLRLSPQHAVLMDRQDGSRLFVRAKHLAELGFGGARVANGVKTVRYCHVMLDRHATIFGAGARVESFYPGREALAMLDWPSRLGVFAAISSLGKALVGRLSDLPVAYGPRAHPVASRKQLVGLAVPADLPQYGHPVWSSRDDGCRLMA